LINKNEVLSYFIGRTKRDCAFHKINLKFFIHYFFWLLTKHDTKKVWACFFKSNKSKFISCKTFENWVSLLLLCVAYTLRLYTQNLKLYTAAYPPRTHTHTHTHKFKSNYILDYFQFFISLSSITYDLK
jgi:hypothetical protein